jgi:hypothetical protein
MAYLTLWVPVGIFPRLGSLIQSRLNLWKVSNTFGKSGRGKWPSSFRRPRARQPKITCDKCLVCSCCPILQTQNAKPKAREQYLEASGTTRANSPSEPWGTTATSPARHTIQQVLSPEKTTFYNIRMYFQKHGPFDQPSFSKIGLLPSVYVLANPLSDLR